MSAQDLAVGQTSKTSTESSATQSCSPRITTNEVTVSPTTPHQGRNVSQGINVASQNSAEHQLVRSTDRSRAKSGHVTPSPQGSDNRLRAPSIEHSLPPMRTAIMEEDYHPKSYSNSAQADPLRRTRASSQAAGNTSPPSPLSSIPQQASRTSRKRRVDDGSLAKDASSASVSTNAFSPSMRRASKRVKRSPTIKEQSEDEHTRSPSHVKKSRKPSNSHSISSNSADGHKDTRTASSKSRQRRASNLIRSPKPTGHALENPAPIQTKGPPQSNISSIDIDGGSHDKPNMAESFESLETGEGGRYTNGSGPVEGSDGNHDVEDNTSDLSIDEDDGHGVEHREDDHSRESSQERQISAAPSISEELGVPEVIVSVEDEDLGVQEGDFNHAFQTSGTQTPELQSRGSSPQVTAMPKRGRWPAKAKASANTKAENHHTIDSVDDARPSLLRVNSGPLLGLKKLRGGPGKRKTSKHWKLNALYDRQMALKTQFKSVARLIQASNEILAVKALQKVVDDPNHYKSEPEYLTVTRELDNKLEKKQDEIKSRLAMEMSALEIWYETKQDYQKKKFESALAIADENAVHRAKNGLLELLGGKSVAEVDDDRTVIDDTYCNTQEFARIKTATVVPSPKKLATPRIVAPVVKRGRGGRRVGRGQGRWPRKESADADLTNSQISEETESFYDAPIARKASMLSIPKILDTANDDDDALQSEQDDEVIKMRSPAKSLLGSSLPLHLQDSDGIQLAIGSGLRSQTNTPALIFPANGDFSERREFDGNELLPGDHEVIIPNRKRGRGGMPNNRMVVKPWYTFEDHEIGIRAMNYKDPSYQKEAGILNPRRIHFDHTSANGDKIVNYTEEDFDQKMVDFYGVHPKYGIPLVGCKNRELPTLGDDKDEESMRKKLFRTNFNKPLEPTKPKLRLFAAEDGTMCSDSLSRTEPIMRIAAAFDELSHRSRMQQALSAAGYLDSSKTGIATYDKPARDKLDIDLVVGELIDAVGILQKNPHAAEEMERQVEEQAHAEAHRDDQTIAEEPDLRTGIDSIPTASQDTNEDTKDHGSAKKSDPSPLKRKRGAATNNTSPVRRSGRDRKPTTKVAEVVPPPSGPRPQQAAIPLPPPPEHIPSDGGSQMLSLLADAADDLSRREAHFRAQSQMFHRNGHEFGFENFHPHQVQHSHPQHFVHGPPPNQPHPFPHHGPRFGTFGPSPASDHRPYGMPQQSQGMPLHNMLQMPPPPPPSSHPQHNSPYLNPPPQQSQPQHISPYSNPPPPPRRPSQVHPQPDNGPPFFAFQPPSQPQPTYSGPPPPSQSRQPRNAPREIRPRTKSFSFVPDRAPMPQYMSVPPPQQYLPPPPPISQNPHYPSPYPPLQPFSQQPQQQPPPQPSPVSSNMNTLLEGQNLGQRLEPLNSTHAAILHGIQPGRQSGSQQGAQPLPYGGGGQPPFGGQAHSRQPSNNKRQR